MEEVDEADSYRFGERWSIYTTTDATYIVDSLLDAGERLKLNDGHQRGYFGLPPAATAGGAP